MAHKDWWFKFEYREWLADTAIRRCSAMARGFWVDMLCIMYESGADSVSDTPKQLGRLCGMSAEETEAAISELSSYKVCDMSRDSHGIVTLLSRRRHRELSTKENDRLRKQKQRGHANVTAESDPRVRVRVRDKNIEHIQPTVIDAQDQSDLESTHTLSARARKAASANLSPACQTVAEVFEIVPAIHTQSAIKAANIDDLDLWRRVLLSKKASIDAGQWANSNYRATTIGYCITNYGRELAKARPPAPATKSKASEPNIFSADYKMPPRELTFAEALEGCIRAGSVTPDADGYAWYRDWYTNNVPNMKHTIDEYERSNEFRQRFGKTGQDGNGAVVPGSGNGTSAKQDPVRVSRRPQPLG